MGTCLVDFLNNIYQEVDRGGVCGVVSLDLAKAFDTVDHSILLQKLAALGFRHSCRLWFENYLSDRQQQTCVEDHLSSPRQVKCGVPQGSILGPLLFICYINDLQHLCHQSKPYLYADDSALVCIGSDRTDVEQSLQSDLNNLEAWFKVNRLSVNVTKTNTIMFCSQYSRHRNYNMTLSINGSQLSQVKKIKYLGLHVDRHPLRMDYVFSLCCI